MTRRTRSTFSVSVEWDREPLESEAEARQRRRTGDARAHGVDGLRPPHWPDPLDASTVRLDEASARRAAQVRALRGKPW